MELGGSAGPSFRLHFSSPSFSRVLQPGTGYYKRKLELGNVEPCPALHSLLCPLQRRKLSSRSKLSQDPGLPLEKAEMDTCFF